MTDASPRRGRPGVTCFEDSTPVSTHPGKDSPPPVRLGRPPKHGENTVQLTVYWPKSFVDDVREICESRDKSFSEISYELANEALEQRPLPDDPDPLSLPRNT